MNDPASFRDAPLAPTVASKHVPFDAWICMGRTVGRVSAAHSPASVGSTHFVYRGGQLSGSPRFL
jgi:hypothetical protein